MFFFFLFLGLLTRVYWVLLSFLDFNLSSLGFTRSSRVSFGILQGLTRLKKVWNLFCFLLDFTGFYLVLLDFTGFCSCFYPFWFVCIVLVGFIMSFTGFNWCLKFDLLGFAVFSGEWEFHLGFYRVYQSGTGFTWVFLFVGYWRV